MQRYTSIHPLFLSFFSRQLYQDVARNWQGFALIYLISLLALCAIPGVMRIQSDISAMIHEEAPKIVSQLPSITILKGRVSIDRPEPYFIRDEKTKALLVIIDTTGQINSLDRFDAFMLIRKSEILIKKGDRKLRTYDLASIENLFLDKSIAYELIDTFEAWFPFFAYPFAVLFSVLYHLVTVPIYAIIGYIFARRLNVRLDSRSLIRLAVVSLTPSLILGSLIVITGIMIPFWWLVSFFVSMGYLFFAIFSNYRQNSSVE